MKPVESDSDMFTQTVRRICRLVYWRQELEESSCWMENRKTTSGEVHVWWSHIKHWVSITAVVVALFFHQSAHWLSAYTHSNPITKTSLNPPPPTRVHHSWPSSVRHFRKSSFRASGLIWFRMPPSRLEVASDATINGLTTVGGICRRTPPTAPGRPFCWWPRDATSHKVWAVSIIPWRAERVQGVI